MATMHNPGHNPDTTAPSNQIGSRPGGDAAAARRTCEEDKVNMEMQDLAQALYSRHAKTVTI
jgi:hypothetical protein